MTNESENRAVDTELEVDTDNAAFDTDEPVIEAAAAEAGARDDSLDSGDDDGGDDGIVDGDDEEPAAVVVAGRPADAGQLRRIVEGALMAAGKPLSVADFGELFEPDHRPASDEIRAALAAIAEQCADRGFELREVASGFRFQVVQEVAPWVGRLWDEKPQKYSRALLETLALIAYRQPITRGDIEDIRGVAVASNIVKTLLERDWVRVVGHKDVPGRPAMYATTRKFLDYFNLKNLDDLPPLAELRDLDSLNAELALEGVDTVQAAEPDAGGGESEQPAPASEVDDGMAPADEVAAPVSDEAGLVAGDGESEQFVPASEAGEAVGVDEAGEDASIRSDDEREPDSDAETAPREH